MIRYILFGLAVAAATAAFILYQTAPSTQTDSVILVTPAPKQTAATVQVLVLKQSLPAQHRLTSDDIGWTAWPAAHTQPFFVIDTGDPLILPSFEGLYTRRAYSAGEPLDIGALDDQRIERLSDRVSQGMRAVAIAVSAQSTAGGLVKVDDYVDIIRIAETRSALLGSNVILENVRVLAVGSSMGNTNQQPETVGINPGTVTVELAPHQATILAAADFEGRLALALRARADHAPINTELVIEPTGAAPKISTEVLPIPAITPQQKPRHSISVLEGETWVPYEVP